jgi:hypothetical protein
MPFRDRQISQEAFLRRAVDSQAITDLQSDGWVSSTAASPAGWKIWKNGDAQFNNVTVIGDLRSANWDGSTSLSDTGPDPTASSGWFLDESAGIGQFQKIYAEGGELGDLDVVGNLVLGGTGNAGRLFGGSSTEASYIAASTVLGGLVYYGGVAWDEFGVHTIGSDTGLLYVGRGSAGVDKSSLTLRGFGASAHVEAANTLRLDAGTPLAASVGAWYARTVTSTGSNLRIRTFIDGDGAVTLYDKNEAARLAASTAGVDITGALTVSDDVDVAGILTIGTGTPIIRSKTTDLIIRAWSTSAAARDLYLQTDDSGGVVRTRAHFNGDAWTRFYDRNASLVLDMSSAGVGFNGQTALAPPNYTITNLTTDRGMDASAAGATEVRDILGTLINDLVATGLLQ